MLHSIHAWRAAASSDAQAIFQVRFAGRQCCRAKQWCGAILLAILLLGLSGCFTRQKRNATEEISQKLAESKTKTDSLRKAMRFLAQMTPLNRELASKEVQLELNTWLQTIDPASAGYSPSPLLRELPSELLQVIGSDNPVALQFGYWDTDYLFERRLLSKLSEWIVDFPLRDTLLASAYEKKAANLTDAEALKLEEACKLFDWTMRNVVLETEASSVEETTVLPTLPVSDNGLGYGYLPWETVLFSNGDFIERGRVFTALAEQREIETAWIAIRSPSGPSRIWAIGVLAGDSMVVFESKLAMPVLNPDTGEFATLAEARSTERILRRLDLPGQFDYAFSQQDLESIELLIDSPPVAGSARMKLLQSALLSDERMVTYCDFDALQQRLNQVVEDAPVRLWDLALMSQVQAASVRERLRNLSEFTNSYMVRHGVWLLDNPAANGRLNHLFGNFENTLDRQGALSMYMDTRTDDETISKLAYDPDVQKALGMPRLPNEELKNYQMRLQHAQYIFSKAKVDAAFLMAQLHFDRGNYAAAERWFKNRVLGTDNEFALAWHPISHFSLARLYQEQGKLEEATEHLTAQPSPQEAGNRLRLRYLRRMLEPQEQVEPGQVDQE